MSKKKEQSVSQKREAVVTKSDRGRPSGSMTGGTFLKGLAEKIREAREDAQCTQKVMASLSGGLLTGSLWSEYERGTTEPLLSAFLGLCIATGKMPMELLPNEVVAMIEGRSTESEIKAFFQRS